MILLKRFVFLLIIILCLAGCKKRTGVQGIQESSFVKNGNQVTPQQEADDLIKEIRMGNPFRPDHATGVSSAVGYNTELRGIIWDPEAPYALIGEFVVREGDIFDNKKVIKINKNSVVLDNNGQRETLKLEGSF